MIIIDLAYAKMCEKNNIRSYNNNSNDVKFVNFKQLFNEEISIKNSIDLSIFIMIVAAALAIVCCLILQYSFVALCVYCIAKFEMAFRGFFLLLFYFSINFTKIISLVCLSIEW